MNDRFNTIAGWVLFAGIVALGLSAIFARVFSSHAPEEPGQFGYFIEGLEEEGGAADGPSLALLLNTGSAEAGEKVFAKCTSCHTIEQGGANGIGPNLYAIMGVPIGKHIAGFAYSDALSGKGGDWTFEAMDEWLRSPRAFASGTKMSFAGLSSPEDRANVILYLLANGGGLPIPPPPAEDAEEGEIGIDGPGEGTGGVAGAPVNPATAAGGMSAPQPVPGQGAAANTGGVKPGE